MLWVQRTLASLTMNILHVSVSSAPQ